MTSFGFILTIVGLVCPLIVSTESPVVQTSIGLIHGKTVQKTNSILVNQYLGIPYAEPPINLQRFQRPVSLSASPSRKIDATKHAAACVQYPQMSEAINPLLNYDASLKTSEDCLYLNVYVPVSNDSSKLPVMVWFTGEGFDFADASEFDGTYLAAYGQVIIVTVQYRIGVFGFLKDDVVAQGNMGLWDMIESLKWIQDNIEAFGGNSKQVTVFGRFSGSMAISHLLVSPLLRDSTVAAPLFQRAILMSGVAVSDWTIDPNPSARSLHYLQSLGCNRLNASKCLLQASSDQLLAKAGYSWRPTIDGILIDNDPLVAISRGEIAKGVEKVMIGSTASEGSICLLTWMATKSKFYNRLVRGEVTEQDVSAMVKKDLKTYLIGNKESYYTQFLSRSQPLSGYDLARKYVSFCSSLLIHSHADRLANVLTANNIETVSYQLLYKPSFSTAPKFIETGAHGDDVLMAFGLPLAASEIESSIHPTKRDLSVSSSLINLFSSFAWNRKSSVTTSDDLILSTSPSSSSKKYNKRTLSTFINKLNTKPNVKTSFHNHQF